MLGETLAHYEILEKLGSGGMGDVYRARDTKLGRDVAIKVLPAEFSKDPERRKRFEREAQAIAALKHPNIVTIHSVEETDGVHYITMEFVEGETLSARIPKDGLPLEKLFEYGIELADAVSSAHEDGITHRDLKPTNVMFDKKGRLKVLDFGLAKLLSPGDSPDQAQTLADGSDTGVGQILGTAAYMSPEQAEGKVIDHRSDIFSLGIVLFEMATGDRPFKGDTHISTISSIIKDKPPHVSEIKQTLPRHLGRIVNHCLEKNADKRFQSAKDIRNDLEGLKKEVDSGELSQTLTSAPSYIAPKEPRNWKPWLIGGGVVVVLAVAGMYFMQRSPSDGVEQTSTQTWTETRSETSPAATEDDRTMAIVLPFENLGPPEDAYFAAGVTGEITSRLAAVGDLGVISRTSATQYDRTGKTIRQIGDDLGVDYVLEGTVQWAKTADGTGRVRITPQLIRVSDDVSVWSDTYDREMDDIFEVQTDIATEVIDQLGVTLHGAEQEMVADAPTDNMEAYQLYLQAKELEQDDIFEYDSRFVELMENATELDPGFVDAWAELSRHHSVIYHYPFDKTEERLSSARHALERAEAIDKDHFRTHLARGSYYYYGFRDYDQALGEFLAATELVPNEAQAREMVAYIYRRQGKWTQAVDNMKKAYELNPQDDNIPNNLAQTYFALREFEQAARYYDECNDIDPEDPAHLWDKANVVAAWKGDLEEVLDVISSMPPDEADAAWSWNHFARTIYSLWTRDFATAREHANQWSREAAPIFLSFQRSTLAQIEFMDKGAEAARPKLEEANEIVQSLLDQAPSNEALRSLLAMNLAMLGRNEEAAREAKLAADLVAKDRFAGPGGLETLAQVYAWIGRHEEAIDILERLMTTVYEDPITPHILEIDGRWDPIRDNPRFQALLPKENI